MTLTLRINVAWCCDEPVSCVLRHPAISILLYCLMPTARLFPPPGGPGPPASKMAPISPGSTHTPSTPSVTARICPFLLLIVTPLFLLVAKLPGLHRTHLQSDKCLSASFQESHVKFEKCVNHKGMGISKLPENLKAFGVQWLNNSM